MSTADYDEAVSLSYWLAKQLGEHVDVQADLSETLIDTVKRLIATMKPRVLEGDWETVRDALDALPEGAQIRWRANGRRALPTLGIKVTNVMGHASWSTTGLGILKATTIARDETPIEVIA